MKTDVSSGLPDLALGLGRRSRGSRWFIGEARVVSAWRAHHAQMRPDSQRMRRRRHDIGDRLTVLP